MKLLIEQVHLILLSFTGKTHDSKQLISFFHVKVSKQIVKLMLFYFVILDMIRVTSVHYTIMICSSIQLLRLAERLGTQLSATFCQHHAAKIYVQNTPTHHTIFMTHVYKRKALWKLRSVIPIHFSSTSTYILLYTSNYMILCTGP